MALMDKMQQPVAHSDLKETVISPDAELKGSLKFKDSLRIDGTLEGDIESEGTLFIGKSGLVKAEIVVGNIIVEGKIEGNITCGDKVELRSTAQVYGDIQATRLTVAEGVLIVGKCQVSKQKSTADTSKEQKPSKPEFKKPEERPEKDEKDTGRKEEKPIDKLGLNL